VAPPPVEEGVVASELAVVLVDTAGAVVLDEEGSNPVFAVGALDLEDGVGLAIAVVKEDSPAAKAGLQTGDIILKLDGRKLKGEEGLAKFMTAAKAGQAVEVVVLRKSKEVTVKVTLGEKK